MNAAIQDHCICVKVAPRVDKAVVLVSHGWTLHRNSSWIRRILIVLATCDMRVVKHHGSCCHAINYNNRKTGCPCLAEDSAAQIHENRLEPLSNSMQFL